MFKPLDPNDELVLRQMMPGAALLVGWERADGSMYGSMLWDDDKVVAHLEAAGLDPDDFFVEVGPTREDREAEVVRQTLRYLNEVSDYMAGADAYALATRLLGTVEGRRWFRQEYDEARLQEVESESILGTLADMIKR